MYPGMIRGGTLARRMVRSDNAASSFLFDILISLSMIQLCL